MSIFQKKTKNFDFVAIGDIVTDAFIQLKDAWIETDNPDSSKELCMRFGDKIPYEKVDVVPAVGNSPDAAVSAHRLGLKSTLVTNLGDDLYGKEQLAQMKREGLNTNFVKVHKGIGSNYHFVLRWKAERTILVKHHEYPYSLPDLGEPKWIYLSSLAENSLSYHQNIADYLEKHPNIKLAFQPGTFQIKLGVQKLNRLYKRSDLFFCNTQEAQRILDTKEQDIKKLLAGIRDLGPKIVVITDGPKGAYVFAGREIWFGPTYPDPAEPVDRTGAGDSFASTFTSALVIGKNIPEALSWGPINSMSVVQYIGAQAGLLKREKLEDYLRKAPESYKPTRLE